MSFLSIIAAASTAAESAAESIAETVAETAAEGGAVTSIVPEDFAFDYAMRVPVLSIILMVIALSVMIASSGFIFFRNEWRIEKREHTNIAKKLNTIKNVTCITSAATALAETAAEGGAVTSMVPEDFAFDYSMRVPVLSIILMVIALAVMID